MATKLLSIGVIDNGDPPDIFFAKISHEFVNGLHVFTSESIPGLFIAEKEPRKALEQLRPVIKRLLFLKTEKAFEVFLGKDFKEFEKIHCSETPTIKDTLVVIQLDKAAA
ncbi:MAG: hypothetical protein KA176_01285 [Alphaproteobacteria bacterium]|nr:hypothetical protein [Alphaproteobacteria bacterium]